MNESLDLIRQMPTGTPPAAAPAAVPTAPDEPGLVVRRTGSSGWVQQVSDEGLLAGVPPGSVVRLETRPGAYVTTGTPLATVWPVPLEESAVSRDINLSFALGPERTMQQDLDFGLRQLADIGLRALSAAVNDATTAVEVVVRIGTILHELLTIEMPADYRADGSGTVVLRPLDLSHADYVRHAFLQLRRAAVDHPVVVVALVRTLRMLTITAAMHDRQDAAEAAQAMLDACLVMAERSDLLPDERALIHAAAEARTPSGGRG